MLFPPSLAWLLFARFFIVVFYFLTKFVRINNNICQRR